AEIARKRATNLLVVGMRIAVEQSSKREDLARRAVAALERVVRDERLLDGIECVSLRQSLDGRHGASLTFHRQREAAVDRLAVEQYRAGATISHLTAGLRPGQPQVLAQSVEQRPPGFNL